MAFNFTPVASKCYRLTSHILGYLSVCLYIYTPCPFTGLRNLLHDTCYLPVMKKFLLESSVQVFWRDLLLGQKTLFTTTPATQQPVLKEGNDKSGCRYLRPCHKDSHKLAKKIFKLRGKLAHEKWNRWVTIGGLKGVKCKPKSLLLWQLNICSVFRV